MYNLSFNAYLARLANLFHYSQQYQVLSHRPCATNSKDLPFCDYLFYMLLCSHRAQLLHINSDCSLQIMQFETDVSEHMLYVRHCTRHIRSDNSWDTTDRGQFLPQPCQQHFTTQIQYPACCYPHARHMLMQCNVLVIMT